jgi:hypothetical protein
LVSARGVTALVSVRGVTVVSITEVATAAGSSSSARTGWGVEEVGNFIQEEPVAFLGDAKAEGV